MKNKILLGFMSLVLALGLTGCGKSNSNGGAKEESKGNCTVFECMKKIDAKNTVEEINKIIGIDGELTSEGEKSNIYKWALSEETSITVQYFTTTNNATVSANYPNKLVSKKADFSKYDEIKKALQSGDSLTYDEFVKKVGGVQGVITQKSSSSITYYWMNSNGGYLTAYFSLKTGKCTMATGRF